MVRSSWRCEVPSRCGRRGTRWAAGLGVLAISPVLLLFSLLLGSADPVFGQLLENVVDPELVIEPGGARAVLVMARGRSSVGADACPVGQSKRRPPAAASVRR